MDTLNNHPRWDDFNKRYALDLCRFSIEVCNRYPSRQQQRLFKSVQRFGSRTTVASGHATGKTASIGVVILWHLTCYYLSNMLVTAPKIKQVRAMAWKEVADLREEIERSENAWIAPYIIVQSEKIYIDGFKDRWNAMALTAPRGSPEGLAGFHRKWVCPAFC